MNPFHYPIYSDDDELYFQISSDSNNYHSLSIQKTEAAPSSEEHNHQILHDDPMTMMDDSVAVVPRTNQKGKGKQQQKELTTSGTAEDYNQMMDQNENKKWMHREIEKQRRQEMARLCTTFRSLLPAEYIKGKRSTSDHMHEGVNYIKHLQNKVQKLQEKRDELMKLSDLSSHAGPESENVNNNTHHHHPIPTYVIVEPFCGGVQIKCSYSFRNHAFPLSRVLDIVLKEDLNLVNCTSTKTHDRIIHTIRSEDPYMRTETDYSELQRKLAEAISFSSSLLAEAILT